MRASRDSNVVEILKREGPLPSDRLSQAVLRDSTVEKPDAARKIIERATSAKSINSSYPVRFDKAFLYYLESHRGKPYGDAVKKLLHAKPSFFRVFKTLLANKGWITRGQIGKASGCLPDDDSSSAGGRQPLAAVVDQLLSLRLISEVAGVSEVYRIGPEFGVPSVSRAAFSMRLETEQALLLQFRDWLRDCFRMGYDSHTVRAQAESPAAFNQTIWDVSGPIYFGPFSQATELTRRLTSGSFVGAEILGYRKFTIVDAESTLERIRNIGRRWKTVAFCPIILAPSYSQESWNLLRSAGAIALTLKAVFGRNIEELMKHFSRAVAAVEPTPENLDNIEKSLELAKSTIDGGGLIGNLRGTLFELLIALRYRAAGFDITLQKVVNQPDEASSYEIDVVALQGESICKLIECKGRHGAYLEGKEEIERHFQLRCRASADPYGWNVADRYQQVEAIFITSGCLGPEATEYARQTQKSHRISCKVIERPELLTFLSEANQPRLVDIIHRYY